METDRDQNNWNKYGNLTLVCELWRYLASTGMLLELQSTRTFYSYFGIRAEKLEETKTRAFQWVNLDDCRLSMMLSRRSCSLCETYAKFCLFPLSLFNVYLFLCFAVPESGGCIFLWIRISDPVPKTNRLKKGCRKLSSWNSVQLLNPHFWQTKGLYDFNCQRKHKTRNKNCAGCTGSHGPEI